MPKVVSVRWQVVKRHLDEWQPVEATWFHLTIWPFAKTTLTVGEVTRVVSSLTRFDLTKKKYVVIKYVVKQLSPQETNHTLILPPNIECSLVYLSEHISDVI